jgi:hypothetical protein
VSLHRALNRFQSLNLNPHLTAGSKKKVPTEGKAWRTLNPPEKGSGNYGCFNTLEYVSQRYRKVRGKPRIRSSQVADLVRPGCP